MHKSENTILIWVLSWAGLLLALLYSPIGSPDMYRYKNYFSENQGVNFNATGISRGSKDISSLKVLENAPKNIRASQNGDADLNIPVAINHQGKKYNYSASSPVKTFNQNTSVVSISNNHFASGDRSRQSNESVGSSSSGVGSGFSSGGISSVSVSQRSSLNNSSFQSAGISTSSVDLSVFGDSTVNHINKNIQKVEVGGLVSLGDDPLAADEPLPVPEGWSFLIVLALIYTGYILLKKKTFGYKAN